MFGYGCAVYVLVNFNRERTQKPLSLLLCPTGDFKRLLPFCPNIHNSLLSLSRDVNLVICSGVDVGGPGLGLLALSLKFAFQNRKFAAESGQRRQKAQFKNEDRFGILAWFCAVLKKMHS